KDHAEDFLSRRERGDFVDGHGDLHLDHCWFEEDDAEPLFIDCIEFRDDFRQFDPASEVAFPFMDFAYRGRPHFGERFLRRYARASDDFDLFRVFNFYTTYRALVRTKVAAIAACSPELSTQQREDSAGSLKRHLLLARRLISHRKAPGLVLVSGLVGSGKSTVAETVAESLHGIVIASDVVRKHLAGLRLQDRSSTAWREGLYSEEMTERVYAGLLERAQPVIDSGRVAVLDATYATQAHRKAALDWAEERGVPVFFVEARCSEEDTLRRLERRQRANQDPSDAGPEIFAKSKSAYESLADLAGRSFLSVLSVDTELSGWRKRLRSQLRQR
ncbi:MAG: AAA family ATPase, partial [Deltaproteobacteria bacterium]|nr:AAA family ATPase [Deltaproteobacteria bacterium]